MNPTQINRENTSKENQEQNIPVLNGQNEFSQEIQNKIEEFQNMPRGELDRLVSSERNSLNSILELYRGSFLRDFEAHTAGYRSINEAKLTELETENIIKPQVNYLKARERALTNQINQEGATNSNLASIAFVRRELENPSIPAIRIHPGRSTPGYISRNKTYSKNENGEYVPKHDPFLTNVTSSRVFISTNTPERESTIPKHMYEPVPELIAKNEANLKDLSIEDRQNKVTEIINSNNPTKVSNLIEQLGMDGVNTMDSLNLILSAYNDEGVLKKIESNLENLNLNQTDMGDIINKIDAIRNN